MGGQANFYSSHKIIVLFWPASFSKVLSALDLFKIYKVTSIQWDSFFTVTLAPLGSKSYPCPVLYCDHHWLSHYSSVQGNNQPKGLVCFSFKPYLCSFAKKSWLNVPAFQEVVVSPLMFATQGLITLLRVTFCISLFGRSLWILSINLI